jgi:1-acyl-sn-glycerol-3-phosphate acyltransferase
MRILLKGLGIVPLFLAYIVLSGSIRLLPLSQKTKRIAATGIVSAFARILLMLFGVRVHVKHRDRLHKTGSGPLIVSNHLSHIDILIISMLEPSVFVTSVELKNTALLGMLARLSGSIFVERRKPSGLKREIEDIAFALGQGLPVVLFPEGTTSNGERVQPFKNSLFNSAVIAQTDIVPVCLRYTRVNNKRITPENRDNIFYYGGVSFGKHLLRLLSLASVDAEIVPLKAISVHPGRSRKDLAGEAHKVISEEYHG